MAGQELLEKMNRSRKCIRPILLDEKQLNVVNRESYKRVINHFNDLRIIDEKSNELIKKMDERNLKEFQNQQRARNNIRESIKSKSLHTVQQFDISSKTDSYQLIMSDLQRTVNVSTAMEHFQYVASEVRVENREKVKVFINYCENLILLFIYTDIH